MTSIDTSSTFTAWRTLLALAVVFLMLATTGWTAIQHPRGAGEPLQIAISAWERGRLGVRHLPDPHESPKRLAAFFASLTATQQSRLASKYPLVVGNMNGAPVTLRYHANRLALTAARGVERRRMHDSRLSYDGRHQAALRMQRYESMLSGGRQFLAFDPSGNGLAAEVFGSLDRAQRVSVVVPGVDTNVMTFQKERRGYSAPVGMGRALYAAERAAAPATRTAVIAWADYTAPSGLGMDAAMGTLAKAGAVRLSGLIAGLPGKSAIALFGHSYGSVVIGIAAHRLPRRVTDVAVAGSPGMRVKNARGLHTSARVWAMRDHNDWIRDVPYMKLAGLGHGADPMGQKFGARVVSSFGASGHSGYFKPGTRSLANFANIGVGAFSAVSCASGDADCQLGAPGAY